MPDRTGYVKLTQDAQDVQTSFCQDICPLQKKAAFKKVLVVLAILQLLGIWSLYKRSNSYGAHSPDQSSFDSENAFNGLSNISQIFHLPLTQAKDMGRFYAEVDKKTWCFLLGTDLPRSSSAGKCVCRSDWNGLDCGVPPSVWNSEFLQRGEREGILIRRRKRPRRIVYSTTLSGALGLDILNSTVHYLKNVVEAFVVAEVNCNSTSALALKLRSLHSNKIVFLCLKGLSETNVANVQREIWSLAKKKISDFRTDDIIVLSQLSSVPSKDALSFLKLYTGFSEPIFFRLLPVSNMASLGSIDSGNHISHNISDLVSSISSVTACTLEFLRYVCRYEANMVWYPTETNLKKRVHRFEKNNWPIKSWVMGSQSFPSGWECNLCLSQPSVQPNVNKSNKALDISSPTLFIR